MPYATSRRSGNRAVPLQIRTTGKYPSLKLMEYWCLWVYNIRWTMWAAETILSQSPRVYLAFLPTLSSSLIRSGVIVHVPTVHLFLVHTPAYSRPSVGSAS